MLKQLECVEKVKLFFSEEDGEYTADTSAGELLVAADNCGCSFWKGMCLPAGIYWHVEVLKSLTYLKAPCVLGGGLWNITSKIKELWQAVHLLHHLATYQLLFQTLQESSPSMRNTESDI